MQALFDSKKETAGFRAEEQGMISPVLSPVLVAPSNSSRLPVSTQMLLDGYVVSGDGADAMEFSHVELATSLCQGRQLILAS